MTTVIICVAVLLAVQQGCRFMALRSIEHDVADPQMIESMSNAGVDMQSVRIVAPLLWPFSGPIRARYYFPRPGDDQ